MTNITFNNKTQIGKETPLFISKWDTTQAGSANDTVVLPLVSDGSYDFYVDWGDGNRDNITAYNQSEVTHQYSNTGIYEVRIRGGITGWQFNNGGDDDKITEISKWGPLRFKSNDNDLFEGCSNLVLTATDSLTLGASNGQSMFTSCFNLGSEGDMNSWDTSSVTNMSYMFRSATAFNQPIGDWDVGNVTNMYEMFRNDDYTNTPMAFNQDIGNWDVGNVTNMGRMFFAWGSLESQAFNNGGSPSISGWDTSNVTNMQEMFQNCTGFNQPIGNWDTSKVTNMYQMFKGANSFNQDLGGWDMTGVTNLSNFFANNPVFNNGGSTGINNWRPSSCTDMSYMFRSATAFNQPIGDWDVGNVTNMYEMFRNDDYTNTPMAFNQDIGNWDVGNVTNMGRMFFAWGSLESQAFNNGGSPSISGWDTSNVTNMQEMFQNCTGFNQPIGNWDTSKVTNMYQMFKGANSFNQDLGGWDMTGVTNLSNFFANNPVFNNGGSTGINNWRPSSCTDMSYMFRSATAFNQPIGDWDVGNVTNMYEMFRNDDYTNTPMAFNQDIGNWDVGNVTNMGRMFFAWGSLESQAFNNGGSPSISGWDTSNVTNMQEMFRYCTGFNQDLSNWTVTGVTNATNFMLGANGLSTTNYDRTLSGWSSQSVQSGVNIHFGNSQYSTATGLAFRNALVASGWTITDGGAV